MNTTAPALPQQSASVSSLFTVENAALLAKSSRNMPPYSNASIPESASGGIALLKQYEEAIKVGNQSSTLQLPVRVASDWGDLFGTGRQNAGFRALCEAVGGMEFFMQLHRAYITGTIRGLNPSTQTGAIEETMRATLVMRAARIMHDREPHTNAAQILKGVYSDLDGERAAAARSALKRIYYNESKYWVNDIYHRSVGDVILIVADRYWPFVTEGLLSEKDLADNAFVPSLYVRPAIKAVGTGTLTALASFAATAAFMGSKEESIPGMIAAGAASAVVATVTFARCLFAEKENRDTIIALGLANCRLHERAIR